MRNQRDQAHHNLQFDHDFAVITGSDGVDSEEEEIEPITIDRGRRHIGEVVETGMRTVRRKEAEDSSFHPLYASPRQTSSRDRDSEGAAVAKHPLTRGDHAREHGSGSVTRKGVKAKLLDSSHGAESSGGDGSSPS